MLEIVQEIFISVPLCTMRALTALNENVSEFIQDTNVVVFSIDSAGKINLWNQCAVQLTGYSVEEVVGSSLEVTGTDSNLCRRFFDNKLRNDRN